MPPLAELQHSLARAVMTGEAPAGLFAGPLPPAQALSIHRGTVLTALVNALRLSYPTVDALVGADFFDHAAGRFAQANLPAGASLLDYGRGFAGFLAGFAPSAALSYLPDVARLDRAIERALRAPAKQRRFALDGSVAIELPQSLVVLRLTHPADEIRAGLGDDAVLAAIDMAAAERFVLVWRRDCEAAVRRVGAAAGRFLAALLAHGNAEDAVGAAIAGTPHAQAMGAIQSEIFAAPFCRVISTSKEQP